MFAQYICIHIYIYIVFLWGTPVLDGFKGTPIGKPLRHFVLRAVDGRNPFRTTLKPWLKTRGLLVLTLGNRIIALGLS